MSLWVPLQFKGKSRMEHAFLEKLLRFDINQ